MCKRVSTHEACRRTRKTDARSPRAEEVRGAQAGRARGDAASAHERARADARLDRRGEVESSRALCVLAEGARDRTPWHKE
eukprot:scaffold4675_cov378-Prasinococcus_capsulatus_cf.AAC.6